MHHMTNPSAATPFKHLLLAGGLFVGFWLLSVLSVTGQTTNYHPAVQVTRLRQAIQTYQALVGQQQWKTFQDKSCLKPGEVDNCVPDLYANLVLTGDLPPSLSQQDSAFTQKLAQGVMRFQRRHALEPDGIVGHETMQALNISLPQRLQQLELNLLRWQLDSAYLGQRKVLVNIPDYTLYLLNEEGIVQWQTAVVVGQAGPAFQTIPLESRIGYMVLNPTWTVPQSILTREIAPIMRTDPGYLARNHMVLYRLNGRQRTLISPRSINWKTFSPAQDHLLVVQQPGKGNALGQIKFMFANQHSIYLHDTPSKALFAHPKRAYSHGCVRVQNPQLLAAYLMSPNWQNGPDKPYKLPPLTSPEQNVFLPKPLPVKLAYYTAWVNDAGEVQFRADVYAKDKTIAQPLHVLP